MYVDIKEIVWTRYYLDTELSKDIVKEKLENDEYPWNMEKVSVSSEVLFDTSEVMSLEDNNEFSTIELYNEGELIYANGKS